MRVFAPILHMLLTVSVASTSCSNFPLGAAQGLFSQQIISYQLNDGVGYCTSYCDIA
ncbi:hypothetical protein HEN11_021040 [Escherichia coli]|nr:hypothetical protein [Escherichia coli]